MKKLILKSSILDGVPYQEYYQENIEYKGLIFVQHGYTSNKEYGADFLALPLARMGYFVVSIDAYKHGERIEEPYLSKDWPKMFFESPYVIRRTAIDINRLFKKKYKKEFPTYSIVGVSMGAMISYYLSTITPHIDKLVPVIGTPDFIDRAIYGIEKDGYDKEKFLNETTLTYLHKMNPIEHVSKMKYNKMLILVGNKDDVVPHQKTLDFFDEYENDNMTLRVFEEGHNVNKEMQLTIFNFFKA
jgi:esterase/lipase